MSEYYKRHEAELRKIKDRYLHTQGKIYQYRAKCISELLAWEKAKDE